MRSYMHKPSEGMRRLPIVVGAIFSFTFLILFLIVSADRIARHSGADLFALLLGVSLGMPLWFGVGYLLGRAIDWMIAPFRQQKR